MSNCTCCFEDYIVKCGDNIQVNAVLEPNTGYVWVITDKFERKYSGNTTSNDDGTSLLIPVADLPPGLLTEFSGEFTLQILESGSACAPLYFKIAQMVNCINFTVKAGTLEKNNLGCSYF